MKKISCIVPAYNEESGIENVLKALLNVKGGLIDEIIVVDDGSKDKTVEIVKKFPNIKLLINDVNRGKSYSVARGIKESRGDYIMMLDADLVDLASEEIECLINPILNNEAEISMSIRKNSPFFMRYIKLDFMTGERVFPKSMVQKELSSMSDLPNLALEVFLNNLFIKSGLKVKNVYWHKAKNNYKYKKRGFLKGLFLELKMFKDILKTVSIQKIISQNTSLIKQSIR